MSDPTMPPYVPQKTTEMPPIYSSPVLEMIEAERLPNPTPACETCPVAMWIAHEKELRCFCQRMHVFTWGQDLPPILKCDGREIALMQMVSEQGSE